MPKQVSGRNAVVLTLAIALVYPATAGDLFQAGLSTLQEANDQFRLHIKGTFSTPTQGGYGFDSNSFDFDLLTYNKYDRYPNIPTAFTVHDTGAPPSSQHLNVEVDVVENNNPIRSRILTGGDKAWWPASEGKPSGYQ